MEHGSIECEDDDLKYWDNLDNEPFNSFPDPARDPEDKSSWALREVAWEQRKLNTDALIPIINFPKWRISQQLNCFNSDTNPSQII